LGGLGIELGACLRCWHHQLLTVACLPACRCLGLQGLELVSVEWTPSADGGPPKFAEIPGSERVRTHMPAVAACIMDWLRL
jgi:hypothetical protein